LSIIERIHDLNRKIDDDLHLGISKAEASQLRALLSRVRSELAADRDPGPRVSLFFRCS
jgi:hypothetical protein